MSALIDTDRERFGVEPICRVLGVQLGQDGVLRVHHRRVTRMIVGSQLAAQMRTDLVLDAPKMALGLRGHSARVQLVWDREGSMHAGGGLPSEELAGFCGGLRCGWHLCDPGDCQAKRDGPGKRSRN